MSLSPDKQGLKAASQALVRAVGGGEAAVEHCRTRRQQKISNFVNVNCAEEFMPIDVVADLEAVTHGSAGAPQVTRYLAARAGFALVALPEGDIDHPNWPKLLAELAKDGGKLMADLGLAVADHRVAKAGANRRQLLRDAEAVSEVGLRILAALRALPDTG